MSEPCGYFIGLMSGTSLDGIDAVVVDFNQHPMQLVASLSGGIPEPLKQELLLLTQPGENEIERLGRADVAFSQLQADIVQQLLQHANISTSQISAIGSHGQTIRHRPNGNQPFTLQLGDPNTLAELTGIDVIADFRRRDMAAGGQGAPLVPAFHNQLFRSPQRDRVIVNIGGMANLTLLAKDPTQPVIGYDTGPGNVLLDAWIQQHQGKAYDADGQWGQNGRLDPQLLEQLLALQFFQQAPPKSTGREQFNIEWLELQLQTIAKRPAAVDIQATLTELTARTIAEAIQRHGLNNAEVFLCGGGAHNGLLRQRLAHHLNGYSLATTEALQLPPDWVEACAFAWLAKQHLEHRSGNLPAVTGARGPRILGAHYPA